MRTDNLNSPRRSSHAPKRADPCHRAPKTAKARHQLEKRRTNPPAGPGLPPSSILGSTVLAEVHPRFRFPLSALPPHPTPKCLETPQYNKTFPPPQRAGPKPSQPSSLCLCVSVSHPSPPARQNSPKRADQRHTSKNCKTNPPAILAVTTAPPRAPAQTKPDFTARHAPDAWSPVPSPASPLKGRVGG
jgi:hypothetical protein